MKHKRLLLILESTRLERRQVGGFLALFESTVFWFVLYECQLKAHDQLGIWQDASMIKNLQCLDYQPQIKIVHL